MRLFTYRKNFTSHNVLILTESVFNKDKNNYCFHIFLGKGSYEIPKITIINKFLCKLQMLYYDRIGIRIDINKTSASKKCDICHYWYFLNKGIKF